MKKTHERLERTAVMVKAHVAYSMSHCPLSYFNRFCAYAQNATGSFFPFFHYCNRNNHIVRMQECPRFRVVTTTHTHTSLLTFASHMNLRFKWIRTLWTTEDLQPMQFAMQNATRFTVFSIGVCVFFSGINKLYHVFLCFCRINNRFTPPNNLLPLPTTAFQSDSH